MTEFQQQSPDIRSHGLDGEVGCFVAAHTYQAFHQLILQPVESSLGLSRPTLHEIVVPIKVYPSRPITIIVPFAAGGPSDVLARLLGERMRAVLNQPVIVENARLR